MYQRGDDFPGLPLSVRQCEYRVASNKKVRFATRLRHIAIFVLLFIEDVPSRYDTAVWPTRDERTRSA